MQLIYKFSVKRIDKPKQFAKIINEIENRLQKLKAKLAENQVSYKPKLSSNECLVKS